MEMHYNLTSVMHDWTTKKIANDEVLSCWDALLGNNGILFLHRMDTSIQDDTSTDKRTITVRIGEDMMLEIRCEERVAAFPVYERATSFNVIHKALQELPYYNQCGGLDGDGNCPQVFYLRKPGSASDRCKNCQLLRKRGRDKQRKRELRAEMKKINETKVKKCLK